VNRAELQRLARDRLRDAKALLAARRWSGAYYLAGYAVECGLKSCVIAYLMRTDQFPDKRYSERCWTHELEQLIALAGLKTDLDANLAADPHFFANWDAVKDWTEATRYERKTKAEAIRLYHAIANKKHGVLRWIRFHW
jgi:hypothetical protein